MQTISHGVPVLTTRVPIKDLGGKVKGINVGIERKIEVGETETKVIGTKSSTTKAQIHISHPEVVAITHINNA